MLRTKMPEAPVHEHGYPSTREDYVSRPRDVGDRPYVDTVAKPVAVQDRPHGALGTCVARPVGDHRPPRILTRRPRLRHASIVRLARRNTGRHRLAVSQPRWVS